MKPNHKNYIFFATAFFLAACSNHHDNGHHHSHDDHEASEGHAHEEAVHFSEQQFQALQMKVDTLPTRNLNHHIETNGRLVLPPQSEATVTATIGANIYSIQVIEGDQVKKGQVLAYLSHPDLIQLQTDFVTNWSQLQFLEKEFQRQKRLYEEKVGSGKAFQQVEADYRSMLGTVNGYEAQLKLLGLNLERIRKGQMYQRVPLVSPIDGHIREINVRMGQYIAPQKELFEIVNNHHIHAHFMVFEKDIHKVKEGQKVRFTIESQPDVELEATIFAVGKVFEEGPKAVNLHAEIDNEEGLLLSGMYVRGRIITDTLTTYALPEAAVVLEGDKSFIFSAQKENRESQSDWIFKPMEVVAGVRNNHWVEIKLLQPLEAGAELAWNNAYYLMAEIKKEEAEHSH